MKVQRHRFWHAVIEKLVDAKFGIPIAWAVAGGLYKALGYYDLLWILATWWGSLIFTLIMTCTSIIRGVTVAMVFIQRERTGNWFWQVGRLGALVGAIQRAARWLIRRIRPQKRG